MFHAALGSGLVATWAPALQHPWGVWFGMVFSGPLLTVGRVAARLYGDSSDQPCPA